MKNKNLSLIRLWTTIALALVVSACGTTTGSFFSGGSQFDVTAAPTQTAEYYKLNAQQATDSEQVNWQIMELKAYVVAKNYNSANQLLAQLNSKPSDSLSQIQQAEIALADAKVIQATKSNGDKLALSRLNFPDNFNLPDNQWLEYYLLKGELQGSIAEYLEASRSFIKAKDYADSSRYKDINESIWNNIRQYPKNSLSTLLSSVSQREDELAGWVDLTQQIKFNTTTPADAQRAAQQWFASNSNHSAVAYTPASLEAIINLELKSPTNIALLLPQSGRIAKPAQLIEKGFTRALLNDQRLGNTSVRSTVYDTSTMDMQTLYNLVKADNIDFIVGPLDKANVDAFQELNTDIDMLALNLPKQTDQGVRVCYMTLSPEQEAEQTAKYFIEQGYSSPAVLYPNSSLGKRLSSSFTRAWSKYAHTSASASAYGSRKTITNDLRNALRGNTDVIYIVGTRDQITLVKNYIPIVNNFRGQLPPLFANSKSNTGKAMSYHDLGGVQFPDMPIIVNEDTSDNDTESFGYDNEAKRIYAFGMDTYTLTQKLSSMKVSEGYALNGKSGILTLGADCVVLRELTWSEFEEPFATDEEELTEDGSEDDSQSTPEAAEESVE